MAVPFTPAWTTPTRRAPPGRRLPLGQARRRRGPGDQQPEADQALRGRARRTTADQVEEGGAHPRSEGEVGEHGVQGVAEPHAPQRVAPLGRRQDTVGGGGQAVGGGVEADVGLETPEGVRQPLGPATFRRELAARVDAVLEIDAPPATRRRGPGNDGRVVAEDTRGRTGT